MYKLHLIRKYLLKRRIAWVALLAVTLCSALVMIVFSVMSGWLANFKNSFHGMTGDVIVEGQSLAGFPYYEEMAAGLRRIPGVTAAVPVVHSFALINIGNRRQEPAQVYGFTADIGSVNDWPASLHRKAGTYGRPATTGGAATAGAATGGATAGGATAGVATTGVATTGVATTRPADGGYFDLRTDVAYEFYMPPPRRGQPPADPRDRPGMVVSDGLIGIRGTDDDVAAATRRNLHAMTTTLTIVPVHGGQTVDPKDTEVKAFWVVDDCGSRVWQLDSTNVYVAFDVAQRMLQMDEGNAGEPARCSDVEVKVAPGFDLVAVRVAAEAVVRRVVAAHDWPDYYPLSVATWEEQQNTFITAVENEVLMVTSLFSMISLVAVLLIFCIFYMIVVEKTRDIGIIKSVGATGGGILSLFLGYGLAIGVAGAALGVVVAVGVVHYINQIHAWLGRELGIKIWDAKTYQFDTIPNVIGLRTILWTVAVALVAAVLGAMIPAFRAAGMNPVDSLRYE